jgi:hypothetical protein
MFLKLGDFVPGQAADDNLAFVKLIVAAVYALFGMATLAMCFDLMQEEIIAKFTWLGKKLGIIDSEVPTDETNISKNRKDFADNNDPINPKDKEDVADRLKRDRNNDKFIRDQDDHNKTNYINSPTTFNSPAPSYEAAAAGTGATGSKTIGNINGDANRHFKSAYLYNVVQRQQ